MADFVYPFNFVPSAGRRRHAGSDASGIGEDWPFKALDRYDGWSGRIEFDVTPLSPLFVPDPEGTTLYPRGTGQAGEPQFHRLMDFFNVDGRLALPATSLKGPIRSVAEALSNSTYGVLDRTQHAKPASFRKVPSSSRPPEDLTSRRWGIWQGDWDSGTILPVKQQAKVLRSAVDDMLGLSGADEAERALVYDELRKDYASLVWKAEGWQLHTGAPHARVLKGTWRGHPKRTTDLFAVPGFESVQGQLERREADTRRPGWKKSVIKWRDARGSQRRANGPPIEQIPDSLRPRNRDRGPGGNLDFCLVDIPNFTLGGAESRLCYCEVPGKEPRWSARRDRSGKLLDVSGFLWPRANWQAIADLAGRDPAAAKKEADAVHYIALLKQAGAPLKVSDSARKGFDKANGRERRPGDGDIVRYFKDSREVVQFGPVAMFRTAERASVRDLLEAHASELLPSSENTRLCPANRLFGWAQGARGENDARQPVAGRVSVGFAWSHATTDQTTPVPLQIQSSPKPGFHPFYLRQANGPGNAVGYYSTSGSEPWWKVPGRVRGRKLSLHHHDALVAPHGGATTPEEAVERVRLLQDHVRGDDQADLFTSQNVTAAVLQPDGQTCFRGTIEFDSLSKYELGLLLWAVSLADDPRAGDPSLAHKIGRGKPHGLGSCRIDCRRVVIRDPVEGWRVPEPGSEEAGAASSEENDLAPGETLLSHEDAARFVRVFKTWMMTGMEEDDQAEVQRFEELESTRELRALLRIDLAKGEDLVRYAPSSLTTTVRGITKPRALPAYEGFQFFVEERKKRYDGGEQPLCTPTELAAGHRQQG